MQKNKENTLCSRHEVKRMQKIFCSYCGKPLSSWDLIEGKIFRISLYPFEDDFHVHKSCLLERAYTISEIRRYLTEFIEDSVGVVKIVSLGLKKCPRCEKKNHTFVEEYSSQDRWIRYFCKTCKYRWTEFLKKVEISPKKILEGRKILQKYKQTFYFCPHCKRFLKMNKEKTEGFCSVHGKFSVKEALITEKEMEKWVTVKE